MDSISNARNYFINQGLGSEQADMLVSKGMEAYNQQNQPQSMMQMASNGGRIGFSEGGLSEYELLKLKELGYNVRKEGPETFGGISVLKDILKTNKLADNGIARLGYQMGGVSTMPMNYGQSLQVPQQMPTNFSSAQNITMNPLLNYGQTPLSMNRGGIARLGYQMGGEAMMQPQMGGEMGMPQMNEQQALETIIKLLIEQGVDPETALKLAAQILQIFAQGGAPAVEAFANQLGQQEQAQAMASGGIAGYGYRQGYGFGSFVKGILGGAASAVKGVANAVKSVAKSPIGRIALTIGANMLLPGAGTMFGAALQSAAVNMGLQFIGGGKFNPLEAITAGVGGYASAGGFGDLNNIFSGTPANANATNITNSGVNASTANAYNAAGIGNTTLDTTGFGTDYGPTAGLRTAPPVNDITGARSDIFTLDKATLDPAAGKGSQIYNPGAVETKPGFFQDMVNKAQTGIQNLYQDPLGTIKNLAGSAYETVKDNAIPLAIGAGAGYKLGSGQQPNESDEDFAKRQQDEVNPLITYYGRNLQIKNPYFYQKFGAKNPFETAAQGGIMGYRGGGSMVPPARQIEGGVIELDARKTGGYIPYGKKERHDDVPAMLAKDEFVFTSRAVKAAGNGDAKRGAAKMYALMKQLEGARA